MTTGKQTLWAPMAHPILPVPTWQDVMTYAQQEKLPSEEAAKRIFQRRREAIEAEQKDPLRYGWELPIWKIAAAMMGMPWVEEETVARTLKALSLPETIKVLLILGGNRGSKSEFAAKCLSRLLWWFPGEGVWAFSATEPNSVEMLQPTMWKYLPPELRTERAIRSQITYICYKKQTGFADNKFTLPNGSFCSFRNYAQDIKTVEGGNIKAYWADEVVGEDWIETLGLRIAEKDGRGIITFTPIEGYTGTVQEFLDGGEVVLDGPAYLLPKDGGPPDPELALRMEDCEGWLEREAGDYRSQMTDDRSQMTNHRVFERAPRIIKCAIPGRAVIFFHSSDNPFGNPSEVWERVKGKSTEFIRERFYGQASKTQSVKFPLFGKPHILEDALIPKEGTNYMFVDPCGGRNFFMIWVRVTDDGLTYIYREWPCPSYEIPGIGFPGKWALPSGKPTEKDGKRGEAQRTFGFGCMQYKQEIARIEGWAELKQNRPDGISENEWIKSWEGEDAGEPIFERYMDSRYGNSPVVSHDEVITLIEEFEKINVWFLPTHSGEKRESIEDGSQFVSDALYYDKGSPLGYFNRPKLYVAESCKNVIFALQIWTGADGQKGATKDPVDLVRYVFLKECQHIEQRPQEKREGAYW